MISRERETQIVNGIRLLMGLFFVIMALLSMRDVANAMEIGDRGAVISIFKAMIFGFFAAICTVDIIAEFAGVKIGLLLYPKHFLRKSSARLTAVESLIAKHDFEGAEAAFEEILREEPGNIAAGIAFAKMLSAWKGADGRTKASALLISQLARFKKAAPGAIDAVILLADYLDEAGMPNRAQTMLLSELPKGYCQADEKLIKRRLAAMEFRGL